MKLYAKFIGLALAAFVLLPVHGYAREYYTGNIVGQCVTVNGATYNVIATVTAPNWVVTELTYTFTPAAAGIKTFDLDAKTRYFSVPPGSYDIAVTNPGPQGAYKITAPKCASVQKGMTWALTGTNPTTGTVDVGCRGPACDPRNGDTPCTQPLPLLCIRKSGTGFPLAVPAGVNNTDNYHKWSGGVIGTTTDMLPPATLAAANAACATAFGADWRVAEFHDGWGWYLQAYGGVGNPNKRFWAHINDQPNGTCWH